MADAPASSARIRGPWHSTGAESSLNSSNISADPFARGEILAEVDRAVANLSSALGIKLQPEVTVGSATIGEGKTEASADSKEVQLEANIVAVIMQSAKGKKLLAEHQSSCTRAPLGSITNNYRTPSFI